MSLPPRVTGHDVARRAGVTQSTVSLVLSGKAAGRVSNTLQDTVRRAAKELGYEPLQSARALRSGRTDAIGLVVPDITNPFLGSVMHGAQQAAWAAGHAAVLIESGRQVAQRRRAVEALRGGLVSALLLFGLAPERVSDLAPAVLIEVRRRGVPSVVLDSAAGMRDVAAHLAEHGHRRVGYLGLADHRWTFERRYTDFQRALAEIPGLRLVRTRVADDLSIEAGRRAGSTLLTGRGRPSAIVCADDILAAGLYAAAYDAGVQVPEDLSIIGYGGSIVGDALVPGLTTVHAPAELLGGRAVEVVLSLLARETVPEHTTLPVQLLARGSVARPA